jgi:ubiquinone/menaquinone biosynthesis C-methylase UbiE
MNWFAAMEGEASTESVSVNYWPNVSPTDSQNWLRNNFTQSVNQYQEYQPLNILDIGSSFGLGTRFIKKAYPLAIIYGLDLSPYFTAISKYLETLNPHNLDFIHANAEDIPFDNETQDLVTAQFLFHEVPKGPSQNILNQAYRVLKPGGTIAIIDLDPDRLLKGLNNNIFRKWAFEITEPHIKEYYQTNICELLKEAKFTHIEKKINDPFNSVWLGKK